MIPYLAGATVVGLGYLGYNEYEKRLRKGDTVYVPMAELRPSGTVPTASWNAIKSMIPVTDLLDQITLTVTDRQKHLAYGSILAPGGAGAIPVEFNVASVITIQRGSKRIQGGK